MLIPKELKDNMVQVMLDNNGIGLSQTQVEFDGQVFVMGDTAENSTTCINSNNTTTHKRNCTRH